MLGSSVETVQEIATNLQKMGEVAPRKMAAFNRLMTEAEGEGILSTKIKELITVALAVTAECDWCINLHVKKALEQGASYQEIIEATWVAILMGGGPSLMYAQLVLDALEAFSDIEETKKLEIAQAQLAIDSDFKELYKKLLVYGQDICNEAERVCNDNESRVNLARNIAQSDGHVLENLVIKECRKRGWMKSAPHKNSSPIPQIIEMDEHQVFNNSP